MHATLYVIPTCSWSICRYIWFRLTLSEEQHEIHIYLCLNTCILVLSGKEEAKLKIHYMILQPAKDSLTATNLSWALATPATASMIMFTDKLMFPEKCCPYTLEKCFFILDTISELNNKFYI
ncbi:hypothetical protein ACJX0J_011913 [Zea mays]